MVTRLDRQRSPATAIGRWASAFGEVGLRIPDDGRPGGSPPPLTRQQVERGVEGNRPLVHPTGIASLSQSALHSRSSWLAFTPLGFASRSPAGPPGSGRPSWRSISSVGRGPHGRSQHIRRRRPTSVLLRAGKPALQDKPREFRLLPGDRRGGMDGTGASNDAVDGKALLHRNAPGAPWGSGAGVPQDCLNPPPGYGPDPNAR